MKPFFRVSLVLVGLCIMIVSAWAHAYGVPSVFPSGLTISNPKLTHKGYTLYTSLVAKKVFLLDMGGNVVNSWQHPDKISPIGEVVKPVAKGHILTYFRNEPHEPEDRKLVELDWDGKVVWEFHDPNFAYLNHDFHRLKNGNTLILTAQFRKISDISPRVIKDDCIIEVNESGTIVWSWFTSDHFDELGLSEKARGIIYHGKILPKNDSSDVFHTNSIRTLPPNRHEATDERFKSGNILVSQRNTNIIFIIDKQSGKIVWRMFNRSVGQHHVSMIPAGFSGAGNILLFNNGGWAGYPRIYAFNSEVMEIDPSNGQLTWKYDAKMSKNPSRSFFSPFRSSAQRLPNGNTLVLESEWGRIFETTEDGKIVWEYINPHRKQGGDYSNRVYRAYRVEESWRSGSAEPFYW